ncbi:MAG: hypothetical protein J2P21_07275 [Chloracidobacterium sp.]|nr:hypothetical protein [Chloracidobacterium sp.]
MNVVNLYKLVLSASAAMELKFAMEEFNRACITLIELAFQRCIIADSAPISDELVYGKENFSRIS